MKKKYLVLYSIIGLLGLSMVACNKKGEEDNSQESTQGQKLESIVDKIDEKKEVPKGKEIVTDYKQFVVPKENQEYNFDTDFQYYMETVSAGIGARI